MLDQPYELFKKGREYTDDDAGKFISEDEPLLQPRQPSRRSATLGCSYCIQHADVHGQRQVNVSVPEERAQNERPCI